MKSIKILLFLFIFTLIIYFSRFLILDRIGNNFVYEDTPDKADVLIVLSGNAYDRGIEAAKLFHMGYSPKIICTGENIPIKLAKLGYPYPESEITKINLIRHGVPEKAIETIVKGTSTLEESDILLNYCLINKIKSIMIVTTEVHTRRVKNVFHKKFEKGRILINIQGAPNSYYSMDNWWKNENNFETVASEIAKSFYYFIKY